MSRETWVEVRVTGLTGPGQGVTVRALVDNGSTDSAMPAALLRQIGVQTEAKETYGGWGRTRMRRKWGHARFTLQRQSGIGKVTFEPRHEVPTIGATTLEDLGFDIDMGNGGLRPFRRRGPSIRRRPHHPLR